MPVENAWAQSHDVESSFLPEKILVRCFKMLLQGILSVNDFQGLMNHDVRRMAA